MFTLILAVGRKELADTLSKKINSKFKSDKEHVNKLKVTWFSTEVGQKLYRYGVTRRAVATEHNTIIKRYLGSRESFVFYRDDVTCNVHKADSQEQAVRDLWTV